MPWPPIVPQEAGRRFSAHAALPDHRARKPGSTLDVACREQGDLVVLVLVGELDTYTTPGRREYARRYDPGTVQLVIDNGTGTARGEGNGSLLPV